MDKKKIRLYREVALKSVLAAMATVSIFTTIGIIFSLFSQTFVFFQHVSIVEFFTTTIWSPSLKPQAFGVWPLVIGTTMIALGSALIAIPLGLGSAIYLSEYATKKTRRILKPILEVLAGIPSVVYGFFALTFITPLLRSLIPSTMIFNAASASIAVGVMILPLVASMSEDAMNAVPDSMRQGAYALGSTKFEVSTKVVVPAALSGIGSAFVLAISRAVGETMIVAIAAGQNPILTFNPLQSIQTMTGFMVNVALGDIEQGSIEYQTVFAVGALLFVLTFIMNLIARAIVKKNKETYA